MSDILFNAEIHDAGRYNEIQEQRATYDDYGDELDELDLKVAQAEWEAEQYEGEPVMELPNDLFMVFDDPDYWG